MTYKGLTEKSRETIKKNATKDRNLKLSSGKAKQFSVYGDAAEMDYIVETMDLVKTGNCYSNNTRKSCIRDYDP